LIIQKKNSIIMKVGIYRTIENFTKYLESLAIFLNSIDVEVIDLEYNKFDDTCDIIVMFGPIFFKKYKKLNPEQTTLLLFDPAIGSLATSCSINHNGLFNNSGWFNNPNITSSRWDEKNYKVDPWRKEGEEILLLLEPPAHLTYGKKENYNYDLIVEELLDLNFKVKIRNHPFNVNKRVNKYIKHINPYKESLDKSLENCIATVGFSSKALVSSVLSGIPVVCLAEESYVKTISMNTLKDLSSVQYFDRYSWCNSLAYCVWDIEEILSGCFWEAYIKIILNNKNNK